MAQQAVNKAGTRSSLLRQIPNLLTVLRLLLALPIGLLIVQQHFASVLWLAFIAGISDGIDGWVARRFNAESRFGAIVDPLSDKALMFTAFLSLALIGLVPWWLAALVIGRDLIIIVGALAYHRLIGRFDMEPSRLSKWNTTVQITYTLLILLQQVWPLIPPPWFLAGAWLVATLTLISGLDYMLTWGRRARQQARASQPRPPA